MSFFWQEYLFFISSILAILVCVSSTWLFILSFRFEQQLRSSWRAVGFAALAVGFFFLLLERKYTGVGIVGILLTSIGFFAIYRGVRAEPKLSHLTRVPAKGAMKGLQIDRQTQMMTLAILGVVILGLLISLFKIPFFYSLIEAATFVFIVLTIRVQIWRYLNEPGDAKVRRLNLYPLIAFLFFLVREVALVLYRMPANVDVLYIRQQTLAFSSAWKVAAWCTLIGFIFLALWAWSYIKVRPFLRTAVTLFSYIVAVAGLASLVVSLLMFNIVQNNNLQLMEKGADAVELVMTDRASNASFVAKTISSDSTFIANLQAGKTALLAQQAKEFWENSGVDFLRVYSKDGEVLVSPSDARDIGRIATDDKILAEAISKNKPMTSLDVEPGVLAPLVLSRSIYLVEQQGMVIGAVESGYRFDNAFVDYAKTKTGLEVTIHSGAKRSASTIVTLDNVSRWVGSEETERGVLRTTLRDGDVYSAVMDRLNKQYFTAYVPLYDAQSNIIGMAAVASPVYPVFEALRQQLITTFLLMIILSFAVALAGFYTLQSFERTQSSSY